jgi:2-dehydropantoate 2-reductase
MSVGLWNNPCELSTLAHNARAVCALANRRYSRAMTRIAVVGPGAVGATFGAAAERAGHAVALCGRREAPPPLVELPDGTEHALAERVGADPSAATPVPWVLLAVKTHQTASAAGWLAALCDDRTVVAVLQNGVEHRASVEPIAGAATVLPAIVWCPSEAVEPGRVRQRGEAQLSVPDEPAGAALADLLDGAARVDLVADFRTEAWRKLVLNAVAAVMVLTGRRAEVYREPEQLELARRIAQECVAVGRAEGARLGPEAVDEVIGRVASFPPDLGTSMLFDRLAGRRLEWDARNGVISRLGAAHGIPKPVSDAVSAELAALDPT